MRFILAKEKILLAFIGLSFLTLTSAQAEPPSAAPVRVKVLELELGGRNVIQLIKHEIHSQMLASGQNVEIQELALPKTDQQNPFAFTHLNFATGDSRPAFDLHLLQSESTYNSIKVGAAPVISEKDAQWYADQIKQDLVPDVLYIGGHHVPGVGFHSNDLYGKEQYYTDSIYMPTLLASIRKYPAMRQYFAKVKLVFIGGCWGLANLEPHGPHGEYLSPAQIKKMYFQNEANREYVLGGNTDNSHVANKRYNSLSYQRWELTTIYGGDFSDGPHDQTCADSVHLDNCSVNDVNRVLPDYLLFDGSHALNMPAIWKSIFTNAYLITGFHSPSPFNDIAAKIYSRAIDDTKQAFNASVVTATAKKDHDGPSSLSGAEHMNSLFYALLNPKIKEQDRKTLIQLFRRSWTRETYAHNKGRVSGSITPAYPDLDRNGLFVEDRDLPNAPAFLPYEDRP